jgi:hypothetical protein
MFTSAFLLDIHMEERFMPNVTNMFASMCAVYVWVKVILLKRLFSYRRHFEGLINVYYGKQLQEKLYEEIDQLEYTTENINNVWHIYFLQLVIIGILALMCEIYKIQIPPTVNFLLIVILAGGLCIFSFFEIIKWEQYHAGEGINLSVHDRFKRILAIIVLAFFSLTAAFFLASENSLFPFSIITGFFFWFFSLFTRKPFQIESVPNTEEDFVSIDFNRELFVVEETDPSPIWELILKYGWIILKYGLITILALAFIRFMIYPLLDRRDVSGKSPFLQRLIQIITEWFKGIFYAITSFFEHLKNKEPALRLKKNNAGKVRRAAETVIGAYSPAKKRDMRRSVTLFARLIIWGAEVRNVVWKPSFAPGEYCGILAAVDIEPVAALNEGIIRCGELFEKALYSAEVLSDEERKEFKNLIEKITF